MTAVEMSQREAVLAWLRLHDDGITHRQASRFLDCDRLAARICEIRKDGHNVVSIEETRGRKKWTRYVLIRPAHVPETEQRALWGDR